VELLLGVGVIVGVGNALVFDVWAVCVGLVLFCCRNVIVGVGSVKTFGLSKFDGRKS